MTIVTPPVAANSLVALVGATTPVGYDTFGGAMFTDHVNDNAYFFEYVPTTGDVGLKKLQISNTGTELQQATELQIFGDAGGGTPNHTFGGVTSVACYHPGIGKLFVGADVLMNSTPMACIDAATLVSDFVVGASDSSQDNSSNTDGPGLRLLLSFQMAALQNGDDNFILSRGLRGAGKENEVGVFKYSPSGLSVTYAGDIAEDVARLCAGNNSAETSVSSFYVFGDEFNRGTGTTTPVVFYEFLVHGATVASRTVRSIAPADIDATWTNFVSVLNPGYDTFDGCVLGIFVSPDAVTNKKYLVKLDPADGTLLWKTPISTASTDLPNCSINDTLGIFNSAATLDLVNLTTGAITTQTWNNGFSAISDQVWDYASGGLSGNLSYTQSTGPIPNYLGAYLSGHSNTIPAFRWGRLFTGQPYVVPANPDPPSGDAPQTSWTYFLDGHQFYVIDLGAQGTFLFDQLTDQWCKFVTTSTTPLWNMAVGTMWNSRVIGGDRTLNKVWELDPNAVLDNAADEITRVVTGMIQRRSRNYMGVGALRVVCSSGVLDGSGDGTITLRFSDDLEHTWSDPFTITLVSGDYSQEIAWRALGSFAAPGRVFEISDSGGLVRVDSADIDPEKDESEQS